MKKLNKDMKKQTQNMEVPYYLKNTKAKPQGLLQRLEITPLRYFMILNLCGLLYLWAIWKYQSAIDHVEIFTAIFFDGFLLVVPVVFLSIFALIYGLYKLINNLTASKVSSKKRQLIYGLVFANILVYAVMCPIISKAGEQKAIADRQRVYQTQLKPAVEKKLTQACRQEGLPGKIKIISAKRDSRGLTRVNDVKYEYSEKVGDHTFRFYQNAALDDNYVDWISGTVSINLFSYPPANGDFETQVALSDTDNQYLIAQAPYYQPKVKKQFADEKAQLNKAFGKENHVTAVEGTINEHHSKQGFKELQQQVVANHKRKLPVGGFYNLNIQHFAQKQVLIFVVKVDAAKLNHQQRQDLLKQVDFASFWDGIYEFNFENKGKVKSEYVTVAAGKVVKISEKN